MKKIFLWIKNKIEKILYAWSKEGCYGEMEKRGYVVFGMCSGQTGGDYFTEYLSYECIDCPYFVHPKTMQNQQLDKKEW